jgi:hypothetical protein
MSDPKTAVAAVPTNRATVPGRRLLLGVGALSVVLMIPFVSLVVYRRHGRRKEEPRVGRLVAVKPGRALRMSRRPGLDFLVVQGNFVDNCAVEHDGHLVFFQAGIRYLRAAQDQQRNLFEAGEFLQTCICDQSSCEGKTLKVFEAGKFLEPGIRRPGVVEVEP